MPDIENLIKKYESIKGLRGTWEEHWEEIAERLIPREMGFVGKREKGEKRTQKVFDSRPMLALNRCSSVLDSMITPAQSRWSFIKSTNPALNRIHEVRKYHEEVNRILYASRYRPAAGFVGQNQERWTSMAAFGTGLLFVDYAGGTRYRHVSLRDCYLLENHQGLIDTVYRRIMLTARQAAQQFGVDDLPDKIKKALENPNRHAEEFEYFHVTMPNEDYFPGYIGYMGKPFVSIYVCMTSRNMMGSVQGYGSFPYSVSRYVMAPDEVYGRGPGVMALPDIKMLNEMSKTDIKASHKLVDPPLLMHDDGVMGNGAKEINATPGSLISGGVSRDGRQLIQPLHTGARVDIADSKMEQRRLAIDDAFLVTLFQILVETPRMTATEAMIRTQEKGMLLTPTMGRQQTEAIGPLIEREIELLANNFKLPPMPEVLIEAGTEYEVMYDSPLSRMQQAEQLVGVQRAVELLTPMAQIDPAVLDVLNQDEIAQLTVRLSGMPADTINSPQKIRQIREDRARQQQAEQMAAMAQPVAGAMKDVATAQKLAREA